MARGFLNAGWSGLWDRLLAAVGLRPDSYFLLFHLENTEILERSLKKDGYPRLLATLSARLSKALHNEGHIRDAPQGYFAVKLPAMSQAKALAAATFLHQQAERGLFIADQAVTPVLSAALLHRAAKSVRDADMAAYGCAFLDRLDNDRIGHISILPVGKIGAVSQETGTKRGAAGPIEQFTAQFQPLICCCSNRISGFDMQVTIPRRAEDGLMGSLQATESKRDEISFQPVLRQALTALRYWDKVDADIPRVSLRLPDCELQRPDFTDWMQIELTRMKMPPSRLVLRISGDNGSAMQSRIRQTNIRNLRKIGCRIELCGFGSGPAGLEALRMLEVDSVRIDRGFVFCCDMDPNQQRTISAILAMARQVEVGSVAEGVESPEEQAYLTRLGCREVQGCAIAPPMRLEHTLDFVTAHRKGPMSHPTFAARQIERDYHTGFRPNGSIFPRKLIK